MLDILEPDPGRDIFSARDDEPRRTQKPRLMPEVGRRLAYEHTTPACPFTNESLNVVFCEVVEPWSREKAIERVGEDGVRVLILLILCPSRDPTSIDESQRSSREWREEECLLKFRGVLDGRVPCLAHPLRIDEEIFDR